MAEAAKKIPKKKNVKSAKGHKLPDPIPVGQILKEASKKEWKLGPSIGLGGFGEIYSACEVEGKHKNEYVFAVKIEPSINGPLFVEMHFYRRNAKLEDVALWKKEHKITNFGMPAYYGSGTFEYMDVKYRFLVLERLGKDLWSLFLESNKAFPPVTVFRVAAQILDVLEYLHAKGYAHADIKGSNILLSLNPKLSYQTYLVDFGLATKYTTAEYKHEPKRAHDGTIEYTSRDAHNGVFTRRGDLEILAYNMLHWIAGELPWEKDTKPPVVQTKKENFMSNLTKSFDTHYKNCNIPSALINFFKYVQSMKYDESPDYKKCHKLFLEGIKESGGSDKGELIFNVVKKSSAKQVNGTEKLKKGSSKSVEPKANGKVDEKKAVTTPAKRRVASAKKAEAKNLTPEIEEAKIPKQRKKTIPLPEKSNGTRKSPRRNYKND